MEHNEIKYKAQHSLFADIERQRSFKRSDNKEMSNAEHFNVAKNYSKFSSTKYSSENRCGIWLNVLLECVALKYYKIFILYLFNTYRYDGLLRKCLLQVTLAL